MDRETKQKALSHLNNGELFELGALIVPFLESRDPDALYLYSSFSLPEWGESEEEFDIRAKRLVIEASELKCPEAMYKLAVWYLNGEYVERNVEKSEALFAELEEMNETGHPKITMTPPS